MNYIIKLRNCCLLIVVLSNIYSLSAQDSISKYSDIFFEYKFAQLDKETPLNIEYNDLVRKYIQRYIEEKPNDLSRFLGLSKYYFSIFESYLDKYDLPLELKYLSVVESGLDPFAKSPSGAVGLWQFLYNSAGMFDLKIDSYIDERRDVFKSTDAACRYFKYLYNTFHDWHLVLAAYNGGPGVVRNAVERSGGKTNLWEILPYMPEPTQNYVPAFLAINYLFKNAATHNIQPIMDTVISSRLDSVFVNYEVNFQHISEILNIPVSYLNLINPTYKLGIIPETGQKQLLVLPGNCISKYLKYENQILANDSIRLNPVEKKQKIIYSVEKGDFLHKIALKFNCNPQEIKAWNHMQSDFIAPGQELIIWVSN